MAWPAATAGVPAVVGSTSVAKLALSSHMCTRGPEKISISAMLNCLTGGRESSAARGLGGGAWKATR
jgi:hypothetical protein